MKVLPAKLKADTATAAVTGMYLVSEGSRKPRKMASSHTGAHTVNTTKYMALLTCACIPSFMTRLVLEVLGDNDTHQRERLHKSDATSGTVHTMSPDARLCSSTFGSQSSLS